MCKRHILALLLSHVNSIKNSDMEVWRNIYSSQVHEDFRAKVVKLLQVPDWPKVNVKTDIATPYPQRFWFSKSEMGTNTQPFQQLPKWGWCCWSEDYTLRTTDWEGWKRSEGLLKSNPRLGNPRTIICMINPQMCLFRPSSEFCVTEPCF